MPRKDDSVIVKTYTCEHCSVIYHAFLRPELEAHLAKTKKEQDLFDKERLDTHIKVCFNKNMHVKKVTNATSKP